MDTELTKLKMKRYISQYEFVRSEYEEAEYMFGIYKDKFYKECQQKGPSRNTGPKSEHEQQYTSSNGINDECDSGEKKDEDGTGCDHDHDDHNNNSDTSDNSKKNNTDKYAEEQSDTPATRFMNKLYKKLSLKTHPDKLNGNTTHFQMVNDAFVAKDILKLIILANKFEVEVDYSQDIFSEQEMSLFEKAINAVSTKIMDMKQTLAWNWAVADEQQKQKYRELYKF
jgi:hypothetical protein